MKKEKDISKIKIKIGDSSTIKPFGLQRDIDRHNKEVEKEVEKSQQKANKRIRYMKKEKIFYESGHALAWVEFKERGCPLTEKDTERDYFLTEKEILRIAKIIKK